jgi:three-Cys-motif partner protein
VAVVARTWGYWTEAKLDILEEYLPRFTTASRNKAQGTTVYLDLFSGEPDNLARGTARRIDGSAKRALEVKPPFTRVCLFELPGPARRLETELRAAYEKREVCVYAGDCNITIDRALADLADLRWAPTFAFIDPYAAEIHWRTLQKLAAHKRGSRFKVELWLLFAHAQLPRGLGVDGEVTYENFAPKTSRLFGCDDWKDIHQARRDREISGEEFRDELVNLMRWRLERKLHYRVTHALELKNTRGVPVYSMVFATDNEAGHEIMSAIYAKASMRHPQMQAEAAAVAQANREAEKGIQGLFPPLARTPQAPVKYQHSPPRPPYRLTG